MRHAGYSIPYQAVCAVSIQASEAVLNAKAVVVSTFKTKIICINKCALGKRIFSLYNAVRMFFEFLNYILTINFAFAFPLQFNRQREIVKIGRSANAISGHFYPGAYWS